jgi:hypothetical protein
MSFSIRNMGGCLGLGATLVDARLPFLDGVRAAKNPGKHRQMQAHAVQPAARPHPGRKRDYTASKSGKLTHGQLRIASPMGRTD